jgi:hypothetical protein
MKLPFPRRHLVFTCIVFLLIVQAAAGQPFPPVNVTVQSFLTYNRVEVAHHPLQTVASVSAYQLFRRSGAFPATQIATLSPPFPSPLRFNESTAGWSYDQEFFYTVRTRDTDGTVSADSEEVWRFLPKVGLTGSLMSEQPLRDLQYGHWPPYLGQWTSTYSIWRTTPRGGANTGAITYGSQRPQQLTQASTLTDNTTWYL